MKFKILIVSLSILNLMGMTPQQLQQAAPQNFTQAGLTWQTVDEFNCEDSIAFVHNNQIITGSREILKILDNKGNFLHGFKTLPIIQNFHAYIYELQAFEGKIAINTSQIFRIENKDLSFRLIYIVDSSNNTLLTSRLDIFDFDTENKDNISDPKCSLRLGDQLRMINNEKMFFCHGKGFEIYDYKFQLLKSIDVDDIVCRIDERDKKLIVRGWGKICIFDADTYDLIKTIKKDSGHRDFLSRKHIILHHDEEDNVQIFDLNGNPLNNFKFNVPDQEIVAVTDNKIFTKTQLSGPMNQYWMDNFRNIIGNIRVWDYNGNLLETIENKETIHSFKIFGDKIFVRTQNKIKILERIKNNTEQLQTKSQGQEKLLSQDGKYVIVSSSTEKKEK